MYKSAFTILILILLGASIGCKKSAVNPSPNLYFMQADINGKKWKVSGIHASFFADSILALKASETAINGDTGSNSPDSICRMINFNFGFIAKPGRYYFNNNGDVDGVNGISANIVYFIGPAQYIKYSNSGYIDVTSINKDNIKGDFTFTAKGVSISDDTTTFKVTNGLFSAINVGH